MTTKELVERATERLNKTGNPPLPPEETLSAIIQLGKDRDDAITKMHNLEEQLQEYKAKTEIAYNRMDDAEHECKKARDSAKEQGWLAQELGKFVRDISNGLYEGQEMAAAKRVYDLNSGSIKKKRLNAYNFDSLDEAKEAYHEHCLNQSMRYNEIEMLGWLFEYAVRP